jgi:4-hydroxy-3-methylbut-2-enyl diphosphate reductase
METVDALKDKFPQLLSPPSDDICYATQNRQLAVKQMGAEADLVIVVGSRNSSNSKRLVEVAKLAGARAAHLVDFAEEIDEAWLEGVSTVGVTSGASVPEVLVEQVLEWLTGHGFEDVEIVKAAEESIAFSLPKELRRDLREEAAALVAERRGTTA